MKDAFEIKPILVAGAIGATILFLIAQVGIYGDCQGTTTPTSAIMLGFGIGASVQIGVRLTGVS